MSTARSSLRAEQGAESDLALPAAVLWDMDGTLVDTEPYWLAAEVELSAAHGGTWDDALAVDLVGGALSVTAALLRERAGVKGTIEEIMTDLVDRVIAKVHAGGVPWRPGALNLLADLRAAQIPCAVVTMSIRRLSDVVLTSLPADTFATIVTGDQVRHGKPHPEPYLLAASRLGVQPGHCIAIEDSLPGLASAEAAGTRSVGVPAYIPIPPAPGRTRLRTLEGVSVSDLRSIVRGEVRDYADAR